MSEPKWTPGPWSVDLGLVTGMESRERFKGKPSLDIFDAEEWPEELSDEAAANAKLIAEAPNLVAMLKTASQALRSFQYGNASEDFAKSMADACDETIIKAGGEIV